MGSLGIAAIITACLAAVASISSPFITNAVQNKQNEKNFNKYNSPEAQASNLRQAGLSPLINGGISNTTVSTNTPTSDFSALSGLGTSLAEIGNQSKLTNSQISNLDAKTAYDIQNKEYLRIMTEFAPDQQKAILSQMTEQVKLFQAQTGLVISQTDGQELTNQILVLSKKLEQGAITKQEAEIAAIRASVRLSNSQINLNQALQAYYNAQEYNIELDSIDLEHRNEFSHSFYQQQYDKDQKEIDLLSQDIVYTQEQINEIRAETGLTEEQARWYAKNQVAAIIANGTGLLFQGVSTMNQVRRTNKKPKKVPRKH